jgi:transposase-like protein
VKKIVKQKKIVLGQYKCKICTHQEQRKGPQLRQLIRIIQGKILEGSIVYADIWKAYDSLILNEYGLPHLSFAG